ncbi:MAG: helix-turn-helix domain-containing protein [Nocardioidaceae bacterium]|nr:helix-turn-helix domain-containing protein [Nocardioidaceae bacterium]NUS51941.1 helix-turn-helix domain-containing protein [Nocardioidaceae bacterium]
MSYSDGAGLDGLQQTVDRLAARLGRSVAIDDTQGRLVVSSGHFGEEDELRVFAIVHRYSDPRVLAHFKKHGIYSWDRPGRIPADAELGFKARVCCPIRDHDILFGHLFLIDEGVEDDEVEEAAAATVQIGQLMYRRLMLHEESQQRAAELTRGLISSEPADRARAWDRLADQEVVAGTDCSVALVARVVGPVPDTEDVQADLQAAVEMATGDRARASVAWVRPVEAVVLVLGGGQALARQVAERIAARMVAVGRRMVVGIGGEEAGADGAAASHDDARLAARAATLLPELGPVVGAESLGVYRLLLRLPPGELAASRYPAELRRLVDADSNDNLVETLAAYLSCAGDVTAASAALHVHRSTLYYRLGRIEEIAGVDLRDGEQRLRLHLGLKMRRLVERS